MRWRFRHFGADVAAVDLGTAERYWRTTARPGRCCRSTPWSISAAQLTRFGARGWSVEARSLGTPEGPVALLHDPSGTEVALLRADRPTAMENAYADAANTHAVRPPV